MTRHAKLQINVLSVIATVWHFKSTLIDLEQGCKDAEKLRSQKYLDGGIAKYSRSKYARIFYMFKLPQVSQILLILLVALVYNTEKNQVY